MKTKWKIVIGENFNLLTYGCMAWFGLYIMYLYSQMGKNKKSSWERNHSNGSNKLKASKSVSLMHKAIKYFINTLCNIFDINVIKKIGRKVLWIQ